MKTALLTAAAIALASATAHADEVWSTEIGEVIYERDLDNGMAVLSYPMGYDDGMRGEAFIMGLAGVYEGRGRYDGIWVQAQMPDEPGLCPVAIAHPETGEPMYNWGRVELIFVNARFPAQWVAQRGDCFDTPSDVLIGMPVTGD